VALQYGRPEEGPLAARLLGLLGFEQAEHFVLPDGSDFYRFVVDEKHALRADGTLFLSVVPVEQRALGTAIREALNVDTSAQHSAVSTWRSAVAETPEMNFHVGFLVSTLEEAERIVLTMQTLNENDPDLRGRLKTSWNRAQPGDPAVDARLDVSPAFATGGSYVYGPLAAVQVFVETDLLVSGPLQDSMLLEFDYVFPGFRNELGIAGPPADANEHAHLVSSPEISEDV
jgi:hypothetical protein